MPVNLAACLGAQKDPRLLLADAFLKAYRLKSSTNVTRSLQRLADKKSPTSSAAAPTSPTWAFAFGGGNACRAMGSCKK